ncbi:DUF1848 domain-containing protein [Pectinatus cerevisiiphilus]|uniref:Uncharacterized protein DUF1848 n=1 Tax=Pectinatus cerevisiiphilus TaxID=86956 RepID=A0A4R3K2U5_9FIRM|nr:DUF1848 domain-containing protein [Pectinatus cerevisiiphilus]TCS76782.1 uncharacterized protein DUF1848 [Pectinatus cerevisiiphilus]
MIISASRRTDIPAFYADWLMTRLREGYVLVPNPRNKQHYSRVKLTPQTVDCFVFWTKNPAPMLPRLKLLDTMGYNFYFQFTLTPYGRNIEVNLPAKNDLLHTFRALSRLIGPERVVWRYDPIIMTKQMTVYYHINCFRKMTAALEGFTHSCIFSFLDFYTKLRRPLYDMGAAVIKQTEMFQLAESFAEIAQKHNIKLFACSEAVDLSRYGIKPACCIDAGLIEKIIKWPIRHTHDHNQRNGCNCAESIDIGMYDSCLNGCKYCYATSSLQAVQKNRLLHDVSAPVLFGKLPRGAVLSERKAESLKIRQGRLF